MSIAGPALALVVLIIAVYLTPQWISRRQALVLSREGDRFSADLRIVDSPAQYSRPEHYPSQRDQLTVRSSNRLLTVASRKAEPRGVAVIDSQQPRRPKGSRQVAAARLDAKQAHKLAALKSKRAARLSGQASAAQRRLLTTVAALVSVVAVGIAAAFSMLSAGWLILPGFFFCGSLVASRLAGIRAEAANVEELSQLRILQGGVPFVAHVPAVHVEKATEVAVPQVDILEEPAEELVEPTLPARKATGWNVAAIPVPAYALKERVNGRQIHPDTDIRGVPQVQSSPGRPIAVSPIGEPASVKEIPVASFNLDLEAILQSRRAQ